MRCFGEQIEHSVGHGGVFTSTSYQFFTGSWLVPAELRSEDEGVELEEFIEAIENAVDELDEALESIEDGSERIDDSLREQAFLNRI